MKRNTTATHFNPIWRLANKHGSLLARYTITLCKLYCVLRYVKVWKRR